MKLYNILLISCVLVLMASCSSSKSVADSKRTSPNSSYNHWDHVASSSATTSASKSKGKKSKGETASLDEDAWFERYSERDAKANAETAKFDKKRAAEVEQALKDKCKEYSQFNEKWRTRDSATYIKKVRKVAPCKKK